MGDKIEILNSKTGKLMLIASGMNSSSTIKDVKKAICRKISRLNADRIELRITQKAKGAKDTDSLADLNVPLPGTLYLKDLGPQIGWKTVFIVEYAGPVFLYLYMYTRPWLFYGEGAALKPYSTCTNLAVICYSLHYMKRIFETLFVHRFSHGTMPIFNLFKNCSYYWIFTLYVAYHVNHPLFTSPSQLQVYVALAAFTVCELGNMCIHLALRNLRPAGSTLRKIPQPTKMPFSAMFDYVSCPNYTFETGAWLSFSAMTQCLPALLFTFAGFYQMAVWAKGKHRNYLKEFKEYPKNRKAIVPFLL